MDTLFQSFCPLLTHHEVQQSVDEVNQQVVDDNESKLVDFIVTAFENVLHWRIFSVPFLFC